MPVHVSKRGAAAVGPTGKVEKRFKSRARAKRYVTARNLAHARKRGYRVPPPKRKTRRGRSRR